MDVQLVRGGEAKSLLDDNLFLDEWRRLAAQCPWATPFQADAFNRAWYRAYRTAFDPLLVIGRDSAGRMQGLLPLATRPGMSSIIPAGDNQVEYPGWVCTPDFSNTFPQAAITALLREFPRTLLKFNYLPPGTPLAWTTGVGSDSRCALRSYRRPLLCLGDGREIENSLKKSGNKSRLRQLKKKGPIEFKHVIDPAEFDMLLDDIVCCHDLRHLEAHGFAEFQQDSHKRDFTRALMNEPGLLHISTFRVGGQLASAQLNYINGRTVQFGLIAHDPSFSHFSPGKLHILFLARMLLQQGYEQIDLTPGGEEYKERFANGGDQVHRLLVYPSPMQRSIGVASSAVREGVKQMMKAMRLNSTRLRANFRRSMSFGADERGATVAPERSIAVE